MSEHQNQDPNDFLMGGSVPSATFHNIGASVTGVICEPPVLRQQRDMVTGDPKTWPAGDPMMQLVVTLQTEEADPANEEDDGRRRIYVKSHMKTAVQAAVRAAKAKGLEVGGRLTVTYSANGKQEKKGFSPPKQYTAIYVPPAANYLDTPEPDEEAQQPAPAAKRPAATPPAADPNAASGVVNDVTITEVIHKAGVWFIQTTAGEFGTRDQAVADDASTCCEKGISDVEIHWTRSPRGGRLATSIVGIPF